MTVPVPGFGLEGRTALVTGSSRGIGRELAGGLLAAGARVILNGRDPAALVATRDALAREHGEQRVLARAFDVTEAATVDAAVDELEEQVGPIDVLVNNAGVQHRVPLLELDVTDWERVLTGFVHARRPPAGDAPRTWWDRRCSWPRTRPPSSTGRSSSSTEA